MNRPTLCKRRPRGFTLVEMLISLAVFGIATLGIWECIRTVLFLSAKNTGLNLSHSALQLGVEPDGRTTPRVIAGRGRGLL